MKDINNCNNQIQGLRGIACALIVLYHLIYRFNEIYYPDIIDNYCCFKVVGNWGIIGVLIFLAISLFYMLGQNNKRINNGFLSEIKQRFIKLWVPYFISVIIIFLIVTLLGLEGRNVELKDFIINLTMLEGFIPGTKYVDGSHWYLTMLLAVSAWVVLIERFSKKLFRLLCYLLWIALVILNNFLPDCVHDLVAPFLASSFVAVVVFIITCMYIWVDKKSEIKNETNMWILQIFILLMCAILIIYQRDLRYLIDTCLSIITVLLCVENKIKLLNYKLLVFIGNISYCIYLLHQNISYTLLRKLLNINYDFRVIWTIIVIALIILLAYVMQKWVLGIAIAKVRNKGMINTE